MVYVPAGYPAVSQFQVVAGLKDCLSVQLPIVSWRKNSNWGLLQPVAAAVNCWMAPATAVPALGVTVVLPQPGEEAVNCVDQPAVDAVPPVPVSMLVSHTTFVSIGSGLAAE